MATLEIKAKDLTKEQRKSIESATVYLTKFFTAQAKQIASKIGALYSESAKKDTPEDRAGRIINAINFDEWDVVASEIQDDLGGAFEQTAQIVLGKLEITDPDIFNMVNELSVDYADSTGAELVTEISDTTRNRLRILVRDAIENADGVNELKAAIQDSEAFGSARAELIATTEIGNAHMAGALEGAKQSGLDLQKASLLGSEHDNDDDCDDNADAGYIGLDELFPSGDEAPLYHPGCECSLIFGVAEAQAD